MKKKVLAVIGVGLMGGSLGLAVKKKRLPYHVIGIGRKPAKLRRAKKLGVCDEVTSDFTKGVSRADLVVICTPVFNIISTFEKILPHLKRNAVVTDVGSVKGFVMEKARLLNLPPAVTFIGGHPLAGSEKTGAENALPDLYLNATVVLTPSDFSRRKEIKMLEQLWRSVGAKPVVMEPDVHDILVAQTSHLPHVLSSGYVHLIRRLQDRDPNTAKLLSGSFRDLTRISDSDPLQWSQICSANRKFVLGSIKSYRDILTRVLQNAEASHDDFPVWEDFFSSARKGRQFLLPKTSKA